jgi:hypothetical protein
VIDHMGLWANIPLVPPTATRRPSGWRTIASACPPEPARTRAAPPLLRGPPNVASTAPVALTWAKAMIGLPSPSAARPATTSEPSGSATASSAGE